MAITLLVRNPGATHDGCRILYHDIGDYLKREEKLTILRQAGSIAGIEDWRGITPDQHHDWIGQRSEAFQSLYPMGSKETKAGKADDAIFKLFSNGYKTSRDAYIYNFSRATCAENARRMVDDYMGAVGELDRVGAQVPDLDAIVRRHSSNVRWDRELKNNLGRRKSIACSPDNIWTTQYRPFVKQRCYIEYVLVNNKYQQDRIFPGPETDNRVICVPSVGSQKPFSALMVDTMPDLHFVAFGQCFPRYRYQERLDAQSELPGVAPDLERIDNITDTALRAFRVHYADNTITK